MKKFQNMIILPILILSVLAIWFFPNNSVIWVNISKTIPIIISILTILYNNVAFFYKKVRRLVAYIGGDTVSWESSFKCLTKDSIQNVIYKIDAFIDELGLTMENKTRSKYKLSFKERGHTKYIDIYLTEKQEGVQIRFAYQASVSYKDSKNEFKFFDKKLTSFLSDIKYNQGKYSLKIIFNKYNPFYILSVRHIDKPKKIDFRLEFEDEGVKLVLYPRALEATSTDKEKIIKVFKEYITTSSIGEHVDTM